MKSSSINYQSFDSFGRNGLPYIQATAKKQNKTSKTQKICIKKKKENQYAELILTQRNRMK